MPLQTTGQFFGQTYRQVTAEGLTLSENRYAPAQDTPRHSHEAMLFYFVLGGVCREQTTRRAATHAPATVVFLPAGEAHSTVWSPDSRGLCFHLELTEAYFASRLTVRNLLSVAGFSWFTEGILPVLMRRLHAEFLRWDRFSPLVAEGIVLEILGEFGRRQTSEARTGQWLSVVETYLREHLDRPLLLTELADRVGIHPSHLVRAFRHRYNVTPGEFVRQIRIEEACRRLLHDPEIPLSDLALELGFADQSHFSRTFRKQRGATPGAYRREHFRPCV